MKYLRVNPQPYKQKNHTNIHVWNYKKTHQRKHIYEYEDIILKHGYNRNDVYSTCNITCGTESDNKQYCSSDPRLVCVTFLKIILLLCCPCMIPCIILTYPFGICICCDQSMMRDNEQNIMLYTHKLDMTKVNDIMRAEINNLD